MAYVGDIFGEVSFQRRSMEKPKGWEAVSSTAFHTSCEEDMSTIGDEIHQGYIIFIGMSMSIGACPIFDGYTYMHIYTGWWFGCHFLFSH